MSWWTCHRGRLCPSAAVGGAISRYLTRICVHIRHMHINEIVITFIIVVIIRTMMMIMMIIANLWIIMNMYLYIYVCVYMSMYVCILYVYVCYHGFLHVHTCTSIHPSVHPSASWICQLQRFWRFCRGVFSLPKKRHIRHRGHLDSTEWMGWDMLGSPELSPAKMMPFFGGMILIRGCVEIIWVKVNEFKWQGASKIADPKGMDMSLSKDFLDGSWTNGH